MLEIQQKLGKIGFVLTGGFMRGAFQVGALRAFYNHRVIPHYIAGVSAGAINGAAFAAGKMDGLHYIYEQIARYPHRYVYRWNMYALLKVFFWSESLLVNTPLRRIVTERINMQDLISSPIKVDIITSDYQSGRPVIFSNKNPEHQKTEILSNAILASAAVPIVFPPYMYKGHQLFDGGVLEQAPLTLAIQEWCDTIFVILNDPPDAVESSNMFKTIYAIGRRSAVLTAWSLTRRHLKRAVEINADVVLYRKLEKDVLDAVPESAREKVKGVFGRTALSIRTKRYVTIHILSPDASEENESKGKFVNYKIIPRFLDRGYRDAVALFDRLEHEHQ